MNIVVVIIIAEVTLVLIVIIVNVLILVPASSYLKLLVLILYERVLLLNLLNRSLVIHNAVLLIYFWVLYPFIGSLGNWLTKGSMMIYLLNPYRRGALFTFYNELATFSLCLLILLIILVIFERILVILVIDSLLLIAQRWIHLFLFSE